MVKDPWCQPVTGRSRHEYHFHRFDWTADVHKSRGFGNIEIHRLGSSDSSFGFRSPASSRELAEAKTAWCGWCWKGSKQKAFAHKIHQYRTTNDYNQRQPKQTHKFSSTTYHFTINTMMQAATILLRNPRGAMLMPFASYMAFQVAFLFAAQDHRWDFQRNNLVRQRPTNSIRFPFFYHWEPNLESQNPIWYVWWAIRSSSQLEDDHDAAINWIEIYHLICLIRDHVHFYTYTHTRLEDIAREPSTLLMVLERLLTPLRSSSLG